MTARASRRADREIAQGPVGRADSGDGEIPLLLVVLGALGGRLIVQGLAEDLVHEVGVQRRFLLRQVALPLQIGPMDEDLVRGVLLGPAEVDEIGLLGQEPRQHQAHAPPARRLREEDRGAGFCSVAVLRFAMLASRPPPGRLIHAPVRNLTDGALAVNGAAWAGKGDCTTQLGADKANDLLPLLFGQHLLLSEQATVLYPLGSMLSVATPALGTSGKLVHSLASAMNFVPEATP